MADPVLVELQKANSLLRRVVSLLEAMNADAGVAPACAECGAPADMLTDTSTGTVKRLTCLECGKSMSLEAQNG